MASISDLEVKVAVVNGDEIQREIKGLRHDLAAAFSAETWTQRAGWMLIGMLIGVFACIAAELK